MYSERPGIKTMGYGTKKEELLLTAGPKKKPLYPEAAWCDAVQKQRMKKQVYGTRLHICMSASVPCSLEQSMAV